MFCEQSSFFPDFSLFFPIFSDFSGYFFYFVLLPPQSVADVTTGCRSSWLVKGSLRSPFTSPTAALRAAHWLPLRVRLLLLGLSPPTFGSTILAPSAFKFYFSSAGSLSRLIPTRGIDSRRPFYPKSPLSHVIAPHNTLDLHFDLPLLQLAEGEVSQIRFSPFNTHSNAPQRRRPHSEVHRRHNRRERTRTKEVSRDRDRTRVPNLEVKALTDLHQTTNGAVTHLEVRFRAVLTSESCSPAPLYPRNMFPARKDP